MLVTPDTVDCAIGLLADLLGALVAGALLVGSPKASALVARKGLHVSIKFKADAGTVVDDIVEVLRSLVAVHDSNVMRRVSAARRLPVAEI